MSKIGYLLVPLNEELKKIFSNYNVLHQKRVKDEINKTCRICLAKQDESNLSSLYNNNKYFQSLTIVAAITECFGVTLHQGDNLSSFICSKCASITLEAYNFKNTILNSENILSKGNSTVNNGRKRKTSLVSPPSPVKDSNVTDEPILLDHNYSKELIQIKSETILNETASENQPQEKVIPLKRKEDVSKYSIRPLTEGIEKSGVRSNGPPYTCKICGRNYGGHYKRFYCHVRSHSMITKPCVQCGKKFTPDQLKIHMRTHKNACDQCSAVSHTGEKPYVCDSCGKEQEMETLKGVKVQIISDNSFSKAKMSVCTICSKQFSTRFNLNKHLKNIHDVYNPTPISYDKSIFNYKCLEINCNSSYRRNVDLINHLNQQHNFNITLQELDFCDIQEFNSWKEGIETHENTRYIIPRGKRQVASTNKEVQYYVCNRTTTVNSRKNNYSDTTCKRVTKSQGSAKLQYACISQMKVTIKTNGAVAVSRCPLHYGHEVQLEHLPLSFVQISAMDTHRPVHLETPQYICECCGKTFLTRVYYRKHMHKEHKQPVETTNDSNGTFKCNECDKVFSKSQSLNQHYRIHCHTNFRCGVCDTVTHTKFGYDVHIYLHKVEMSSFNAAFNCKFCSSTFSNKSDLELHLREHMSKPYRCKHCKESFDSKILFNRHVTKYCDGRSYHCMQCNKTFKSSALIIQHKKIHAGKRPYTCQICSRSFTRQQQLSVHMLTHTGEKNYVCQYCGKAFALKCNLTVHVRRHTGTTPFYCDICGKGFCESSSLKRHLKWKHKENVKTEPVE